MNDEQPKKQRRTLTIEEKIAHLRGQAKARLARAEERVEKADAALMTAQDERDKAKADLAKLGGGE